MSNTNETNAPESVKLSELSPVRTAGALPSSRTFSALFERGYESDDIDVVKGILEHVWAHYQALELFLHDREANLEMVKAIKQAIADGEIEADIDLDEALVGFMATGAIDGAYQMVHQLGIIAALTGAPHSSAVLRYAVYKGLDWSDPIISDEDIEALLHSQDETDAEDRARAEQDEAAEPTEKPE